MGKCHVWVLSKFGAFSKFPKKKNKEVIVICYILNVEKVMHYENTNSLDVAMLK